MDNKLSYQELVRLSLVYHIEEDFDKWSEIHNNIYFISQFYHLDAWFKEGKKLADDVKESLLYKELNEE